MSECNSICVYCGSSGSVDGKLKQLAVDFGTELGKTGRTLVYGGGKVGLMGLCADAVLANGGKVIGIIPSHISEREVQHLGLTELHVVPSMHVRKQMMVDRADAFVVLPGGIGTLDELCEVLTWRQLGVHDKPIVIVNTHGYWSPFIDMIDHIIDQGFMRPSDRKTFMVVDRVEDVLPFLTAAPQEHFDPATKWI